jgi:hypothetical protein
MSKELVIIITVEIGKSYWITFDDNGEDFRCLLAPFEEKFLYIKNKNFRYTHYINYKGFNLNQMNVDYINDSIKYKTSIALSSGKGQNIIYLEVKSIEEIKEY